MIKAQDATPKAYNLQKISKVLNINKNRSSQSQKSAENELISIKNTNLISVTNDLSQDFKLEAENINKLEKLKQSHFDLTLHSCQDNRLYKNRSILRNKVVTGL